MLPESKETYWSSVNKNDGSWSSARHGHWPGYSINARRIVEFPLLALLFMSLLSTSTSVRQSNNNKSSNASNTFVTTWVTNGGNQHASSPTKAPATAALVHPSPIDYSRDVPLNSSDPTNVPVHQHHLNNHNNDGLAGDIGTGLSRKNKIEIMLSDQGGGGPSKKRARSIPDDQENELDALVEDDQDEDQEDEDGPGQPSLSDADSSSEEEGQRNSQSSDPLRADSPDYIMHSPRTVNTKYGVLQGIVITFAYDAQSTSNRTPANCDSSSSSSSSSVQLTPVEAFLGVPYASPPSNHLRFMPPVAPVHWRGVRQANHLAPVCPQPLPQLAQANLSSSGSLQGDTSYDHHVESVRRQIMFVRNQSEDCLHLNIYVPFGSYVHKQQQQHGKVHHPRTKLQFANKSRQQQQSSQPSKSSAGE